MQLFGVAAILFSYLGARSLAGGEQGKKAWALAIGGVFISITMGIASLLVSHAVATIQPSVDPVHCTALPVDWGENMSPDERERNSLIYARMAYTGARKIINYVDQSGNWKSYCPTPDDAKRIAEFAETTAQAQTIVKSAWNSALSWWISGGIALLAGMYIGRRSKNVS